MTAVQTPRMFPPDIFSRFYLILDDNWASRCSLLEVLQQASEAGVKLVQYRNKTGSMKQAYDAALVLRKVATERGMTFIV
ncbi:MAG: thiamine phosphate synthase, partial [Nitrospira sp.]|nr:thiamine phosphate synthase [Nitrospira sp.]